MRYFNQERRAINVTRLEPEAAAALVYQWVKTDVITKREFCELYPLIDKENHDTTNIN